MNEPLKIIRLTPAGRGAVASLLLTGSGAAEAFLRHWTGKNPLMFETASADKPFFGKIRLDNHGQTKVSEEAVVHFISPEEIEIHCHGGTAVIKAIQNIFSAEGAVLTSWQEHYCFRQTQTETALKMLPFAETERTAQILLSQLNGALEKELKEIENLRDIDEKYRRLERLRQKKTLGQHIVKPFSVVLAGEVNAGKSSLLNAIIGFQRVITDSSPGTTRDTVSVKTAINGFMFEFSDTAGFRDFDSNNNKEELQQQIEREGIKRAEELIETADLVLWIVDSAETDVILPQKRNIMQITKKAKNVLFCYNKTDLPASNVPEYAIGVSAASGEGIEKLLQTVFGRLIPYIPEPDEGVPLTDFP